MKKVLLPGMTILLLLINVCSFSQSTTFNYTGTVQTYTVGAGVTTDAVDVQGAMGGGINCGTSN